MFGPSKVSKSLIDAVLQVTENKTTEQVQLDEAQSEKVPTPTGMKVYGHRYGDSAKARKDQTKAAVDTMKGPKKKELIEDEEELQEDGDCVTKPEAKSIAKKEVHHHNKTMHKGQKDTTKNEETEVEQPMSFKDRLLERAMTDAESKKKEKIVMSMKDKQSYFKKKYGKRWKEVMYATATKQAMKEEMAVEEDLDEEESGLRMAAHAAHREGKKMFTFKGKTYPITVKKEEVELDEKNESHTHAAHYENDKGEWTGMNLLVAKDDEDAIRQAHEKCKDGCRLSRVERHIPVKEEVEELDEAGMQNMDIADKKQKMATASNTGKGKPMHNVAKGLKAFLQGKKEPMESVGYDDELVEKIDLKTKTVDMLRGRVKVSSDYDDSKEHKSSKVKLSQEETEKETYGTSKQADTKSRNSIKTHDGLPGKVDNLDPKYGKPDAFEVHTEAKDPETSDAFGGQANFATNGQTSSDEPKKKELSEVSVDEKVIAGTPGWEKVKGADVKGNVKDKSGAVHTPMSRAKDLARQAFKKVKNEMLGQAPNNQTGV